MNASHDQLLLTRLLAVFLASGVGACGPASPPPGPPETTSTAAPAPPAERDSKLVVREGDPDGISSQERVCVDDADCVLSRFNGCCSCPRPEPYAIHREALTVNEAHCASVDCDGLEACSSGAVDVTAWEASCRADRCVAHPRD